MMAEIANAGKNYQRYKIDGVRKALRMAERLKLPDVFNWAEILRAAEEIMKNAGKSESEQEDARRHYLAVLAGMDADAVPAPLKPIIATARAILAVDGVKQATQGGDG